MPDLVQEDGRIHTSYSQISTVTGRLASKKPNMQNIPKREPEKAKEVRNGIIASNGFKFIEADYAQIEFRLLASECGDEVMIKDGRGDSGPNKTAKTVYEIIIQEYSVKYRLTNRICSHCYVIDKRFKEEDLEVK